MAQFDVRSLTPHDRYNLITGTVGPRPIALITTINESGGVNAAPFSFFNVLGADPPIVAFTPGFYYTMPPRLKDTGVNVLANKEFVVNMVTEELTTAMNIAGADFPEMHSEIEAMGVTLSTSRQIKPPRILESPVNLECVLVRTVEIGQNQVLFGEVVEIHIKDDLIDPKRMHVRYDRLNYLGRMAGGSGVYSTTRDLLIAPRVSYEQVRADLKDAHSK
ncbi:hypothetical protein BSN85_22455 [Bradyrhizobium brasilense]|uniref:flavin reductase family protein n=1 Tax=Bradyrhizobium brasilense TaxID=1419277 RepID=UPI000977A558|nr:flavin reductase family protein [Bradyrhizobium brasilense]OMI06244.1 hypothetical protein BSN85_22455 [Bradyrhizobium brasilense]